MSTPQPMIWIALRHAFAAFDQNVVLSKPAWSVDQIPDLSGKVAIVTGGNNGLGKETVKNLLKHNAKVYVAARNPSKAKEAIAELKDLTGKEALFLQLDLADLNSVKKAAQEYQRLETRLDMLFNNAGVMFPAMDQLTEQGFDLQFGANTLGHFLLTKLLMPTLLETAKTSPNHQAHIATTSSFGHYLYPDINFNTLRDSPARHKLGGEALYGQTNFIKILMAKELAERYKDQGIVSMSIHPGTIGTNLFDNLPSFASGFVKWAFPTPEKGALTQLRAGTDPTVAQWNGQYMKPWGRVGGAHKNSENVELRKKIWEYMEEQVKDFC